MIAEMSNKIEFITADEKELLSLFREVSRDNQLMIIGYAKGCIRVEAEYRRENIICSHS